MSPTSKSRKSIFFLSRRKCSKKNCSRKRNKNEWRFTTKEPNLQNINPTNIVRISERSQSRRVWRIVPKDSCEVYRAQLKKKKDMKRKKRSQSKEDTSSDETEGSHKGKRRRNSRCKKSRSSRHDSSSSKSSSTSYLET